MASRIGECGRIPIYNTTACRIEEPDVKVFSVDGAGACEDETPPTAKHHTCEQQVSLPRCDSVRGVYDDRATTDIAACLRFLLCTPAIVGCCRASGESAMSPG